MKRKKLIDLLKYPMQDMKTKLAKLKQDGQLGLSRKDFIWHYILQSFATWGRSKGFAGLIENKDNYNKITYEALERFSNDESRLKQIEETLNAANIRYSQRKAQFLLINYCLIKEMGGLEATKRKGLETAGKAEKIKFLHQFKGIGPKYARNIWMDVYHPDFHNSIAIDTRINNISQLLGCEFKKYEDHERFYLDIAREANLQGWEVDRLLYNFNEHFIKEISMTI